MKNTSSGNEGVSVFKFPKLKAAGYINKTIAVPNTEENRAKLRKLQEIANRDFYSPRKRKGALNRLTIQSWTEFLERHYKGNPQKLLEVKPVQSETKIGFNNWEKCSKRAMRDGGYYCKPRRKSRMLKVGPDFIKCAQCTKKHGNR